jgi:hypothetical protein
MDKPKFDVQRALAAMADYPAVLRHFGVIRILEIDLTGTQINPATAGPVKVTVTPDWTKKITGTRNIVPMTVPAYLSATKFALTEDGRVDLAAGKITVSEVDTDSAANRLVDLARQVVNAEQENAKAKDKGLLPPMNLPTQLALPPMRNAGFSLNQGDRAVELRNMLVAGKDFHRAASPSTLTSARQAIIGHVLDVWDDRTKRWHTVCARRGTYSLPGGTTFTVDDLGPVSLGATAKEGANNYSTMFLHQSLVRWTGWSLVAPRPGKVVVEDDGVEPLPGDPALPGFSPLFEPVPGTLPLLRFGVGYRFQLRTVDLVGRAEPLVPTSTDFTRATSLKPYLRFEPIVSPIVVATAPMTEGESVETLVFRPQPWPDGPPGSNLSVISADKPARHVAPPKVPMLLCEEHGKFDKTDGTPDTAKYQTIATRDAADLMTIGKEDPGRPKQRYVSGSLPVTWLPDPVSRGAAISGLPTGLLKTSFDNWPDGKSFRVTVSDGTQPPSWNSSSRLLTINVPRGEMRDVRLSSHVNTPDLALLGQLGWLGDSGASAAEVDAAKADVLNGQAWQVTPYRTLHLVNAVRVPVKAPVLNSVTPAARAAGSTEQKLAFTSALHQPSTGILTLQAKWTDPVDDPAADGPSSVTAKATPLVQTLDYGDASTMDFNAKHAFGDTKRHIVDYTVEGTTRYMEYFVQRGKIKLTGTTPVSVAKPGIADGSDVIRSLDGKTTYRRGDDYVIVGGTIARTEASTIPSGATVDVALVCLPVSRVGSGKAVTKDLPSTARPMPPKVAWIVPTFGWKETNSDFGRKKTRARSGGGLRIFLERGWYSSGVGEQLAVVLSNGGSPTDPQLVALLTQAGADPTVKTALPKHFPANSDFPLAVSKVPDLHPAEVPAAVVSVAAHDVFWDEARRRWACDIVLPAGSVYQPFVSLALARYQPNSVAGTELSPLASIEWAQLAPDRAATVTMDLFDLTHVKVTVAGQSGTGTVAAPASPNKVSVIVQTASGLNPGDLDWQVSGPAAGTALDAAMSADGFTTWSGTLNLGISRFLKPHRLVIVEHESNTGGGRLIYSDVIRL